MTSSNFVQFSGVNWNLSQSFQTGNMNKYSVDYCAECVVNLIQSFYVEKFSFENRRVPNFSGDKQTSKIHAHLRDLEDKFPPRRGGVGCHSSLARRVYFADVRVYTKLMF